MIWATLAVVFGPGLLLVAACLIHDGVMNLRERHDVRQGRSAWSEHAIAQMSDQTAEDILNNDADD